VVMWWWNRPQNYKTNQRVWRWGKGQFPHQHISKVMEEPITYSRPITVRPDCLMLLQNMSGKKPLTCLYSSTETSSEQYCQANPSFLLDSRVNHVLIYDHHVPSMLWRWCVRFDIVCEWWCHHQHHFLL